MSILGGAYWNKPGSNSIKIFEVDPPIMDILGENIWIRKLFTVDYFHKPVSFIYTVHWKVFLFVNNLLNCKDLLSIVFWRFLMFLRVILECSVIQMEQFAAKFITMTKILTMTTTQSHTLRRWSIFSLHHWSFNPTLSEWVEGSISVFSCLVAVF